MDPGDPFPDERCRTAREDGGVTVERRAGPVRADHRERRLYLRQQAGQFGAVMVLARGHLMGQNLAGRCVDRQMQRGTQSSHGFAIGPINHGEGRLSLP